MPQRRQQRTLHRCRQRRCRWVIALTLSSLLATSQATAWASGTSVQEAASDMVDVWIERLLAFEGRRPLRTEYSMEANVAQQGVEASVRAEGVMTSASTTEFRVELETRFSMGEMGEMTMTTLSVADGTILWTESLNEALDLTTVSKMPIEKAMELGGDFAGGPMGGQPALIDPFHQIKSLVADVDFQAVRLDGDVAILEGVLEGDVLELLDGTEELGDLSQVTISIDRASGAPRGLVWGSVDAPFMGFEITKIEFLESAPAELFQYEPPAGSHVLEPFALEPFVEQGEERVQLALPGRHRNRDCLGSACAGVRFEQRRASGLRAR